MYASSMRTIASRRRSAMRRRSAIGNQLWPVGLFGVLRKIIRVRGVIAAMHRVGRKREPGPVGMRTDGRARPRPSSSDTGRTPAA